MSKQKTSQSFNIPELPALPTPRPEAAISSNGDVDPIISDEGDFWVPVVVGSLAGHYCPQKHRVVAATGNVYTPTGFECAGGKDNNRKWRLSIRVLLPGGERGRTLGMWLVSHKLDHLTPQTSPRKSGSSAYRSSEDNNSGTRTGTTTSSGPGSSQETGSLTLAARTSPEKRTRNHDEDDAGPSQDDASPSKMLRRAFFHAPTGNSLNIPEPTPPPMSPNPADVIGAFMQNRLAIHSPLKSPSLGVTGRTDPHSNAILSSPPNTKNNFNLHTGATPTPMHTPESPPQLQSLLPMLHAQLQAQQRYPPPPLEGLISLAGPLGHPVPFGTALGDVSQLCAGGAGIINKPFDSYLASPINQNVVAAGAGGGGITLNGAVISTGVPIYPSRVIESDFLDPELNNEVQGKDKKPTTNDDTNKKKTWTSPRRAKPQAEEGLGGASRAGGDDAGGGGSAEGQQTRPSLLPRPAVAAPPTWNPTFPTPPFAVGNTNFGRPVVYSTTPMPTAAALAAARAAAAQHHVESIEPLHFIRQDSGSSLDLAKVFDYGDLSSPGGGLTGFTGSLLQHNPGGGSADWGDVQSITFSLGGGHGGGIGRATGRHCGRFEDKDEEGDNGRGGNIPKRVSDASTDSFSNGRSRHTSPPPEMLNVCTPEGKVAAEDAVNKTTTPRAEKEKEDVDILRKDEVRNDMSSGSSNLDVNESES